MMNLRTKSDAVFGISSLGNCPGIFQEQSKGNKEIKKRSQHTKAISFFPDQATKSNTLHLLLLLLFLLFDSSPSIMMAGHHLHLQNKEAQSSPRATSPNSTTTSCSISSNNGTGGAAPSPQPLTPKSIDGNPSPTTFIQADTSSFKQVVQMLTGSADTAAKHASAAPKNPPAASKVPTGPKKPAFKLYERRGSLKNLKMIGPAIPSFVASSTAASSPRKQQLTKVPSPSVLDFPSLAISPVTPLVPDLFNRKQTPCASSAAARSAEDRAIAEKGFYLHPSPRTTPREAEPPRLLPLFPLTSPRMSSASAAGSSA
ncbi:VQ motif-containing protein 4-like [Canna indica]|uniref:VQ motif-containing protein 4-like n=1 Tax=Canna indica TaxID=4628 RepID=A0AAQ3JM37_9LILI|nr:VQ motif-containing protein 4-like [Canna indica]